MAPTASPIDGLSARREAERFKLVGPSVRIDSRVHAVRRDIADIGLADRVFAPHYARPEARRCIAPSTMIRAEGNANARAVSQLLAGEDFAIIDVSGGWAWGYSVHDRYVGHIPADAIDIASDAPTHIVHAAAAPLFSAPDIKSAARVIYPMGARVSGGESEDDFLAVSGGGWLHLRHVRAIADVETDPVTVATRLLGAPYLWGGRGAGGVDCSGLVQLALGLCGIDAPRDSDQQRALGDAVEGDPQRGDLVFFPGHVGFMADSTHLLHANAHWMAVTIEPLADVVARLAPLHDQPVLARRRLCA